MPEARVISDLIFGKWTHGLERNPLLKHRVALDWIAALVALFLVGLLIAGFKNQAISGETASNLLLAVMATYLIGELATRVDALLKLAGLLILGIGLFAYLAIRSGIDTAADMGVQATTFSVIGTAISAPFLIYLTTQRGTYHYRAVLVGFGFFTLLTWLTIFTMRGHLDPTGNVSFLVMLLIFIGILAAPSIIESIALKIGWPICTITYLAIKSSGGDFAVVVDQLAKFGLACLAIVFAFVASAVAFKTFVQGSRK